MLRLPSLAMDGTIVPPIKPQEGGEHVAGINDLRVIKTRHALLASAPFAKITVNDLCAQALVSLSAFYAHFRDKFDLAACLLKGLSDQLFEEAR